MADVFKALADETRRLDVQAEYERLAQRGVVFTQTPTDLGNVVIAVFDDTCGNLVQIVIVGEAAHGGGTVAVGFGGYCSAVALKGQL